MRAAIPILLAGLLAGCEWCGDSGVSVHPLYEAQDLVFEPGLVGDWKVEGEKVKIEKSGEHTYELTAKDEKWTLRVVKLGGAQFVDITAAKGSMFSFPGHGFAKARIDGDVVQFSMMNPSWLAKKAASDRSLVHENVACGGGTVLVTASTRELQNFVLGYADSPEAFAVQIELRRVAE